MVEELFSVLERVKGTSSRLEKESIVAEFKENGMVRQALNFLFNDFITTGLDVKKLDKKLEGVHTVRGVSTLTDMFKFLEQHNTGTDAVIRVVQLFIRNNAKNDQEVEFLKQLLTKTYKVGITSKTVNKAFGEQFIPEFNVQLAHPYEKYADKVVGDFAITTKLDGNRMLAIVDQDGEVTFFTRKGKPIDGLEEIAKDVKSYAIKSGVLGRAGYDKGFVLDGEVLIKDYHINKADAFQETMKIVRTKGLKKGLDFWVFDIVPLKEFLSGESNDKYLKRKQLLDATFNRYDYNSLINLETLYIGSDKSMIGIHLDDAIYSGDEGIMINLDTTYKCRRHVGLLKAKEFKTADVEIIGYFEGLGALKGSLGGIIINWKGCEVRVGSGFSHEQRHEIWSKPESILNKIVEIQYFEETTNQNNTDLSLRFPTFVRMRPDKTVADINYDS